MGDPWVTIVIPVHNGEDVLPYALDAALAQTDPDFRLIVVDDGSTDRSRNVADEYAGRDSRISVMATGAASGGPAHPGNLAIATVATPWTILIADDDELLPEALELHRANTADADVSYGAAYIVNAAGDLEVLPAMPVVSLSGLVDSNPVIAPSAMIRTAALSDIGGMSEERAICGVEDWDLWIRLLLNGARFRLTYRPLSKYLPNSTSLSRQHEAHYLARVRLFQRLADQFPEHADLFSARARRAERELASARYWVVATREAPPRSWLRLLVLAFAAMPSPRFFLASILGRGRRGV